jgi:hypothetical protein
VRIVLSTSPNGSRATHGSNCGSRAVCHAGLFFQLAADSAVAGPDRHGEVSLAEPLLRQQLDEVGWHRRVLGRPET